MYLVTLNNNVLHDNRIKDYQLLNPVCSFGVNKTNSFMFTILPTHPMYNSIERMKSIIEVFDDGILIFRGRALNDTSNFNKAIRIECECELGYLNDSTMEPYNHFGSLRELLTLFINNHNSQVDNFKKFKLGTVNVTGDLVRSNVEYSNSWEELSAKTFKSSIGGYLHLRREDEINYIDYLNDSPYISGQSIELKKNMIDYEKTVKTNDIATVLIPLGARLLDDEGNETNERLTIESVNSGSKFVKNQSGVEKYGNVVAYKIWNDIRTPQLLKERAIYDLNFLINLGVSIKIKAIDLSLVDKSIPKIRYFQYVRIKSKVHNMDEEMLIKKQTIYLDNPSNNTIEVGVELSTFTDSQLESSNAIKIINANYITNEKLNSVVTPINTQVSQILQQSDLIVISVENIKEEIKTIETTPGPPGNGIKTTAITYQKSTSGTDAPTGTWSTNVPTPTAGQYLWTRTITTYTNNTSVTTYSVSYYAKDGSSGNGIKSTKATYQLHINGSTAPTGTWLDEIPPVVKGRYLWTRTVLTLDDDKSLTSYSTSYYPLDGQKGDKGDPGIGIKGDKGDDGVQLYNWLKFADTPSTGMSDSSTGKKYIGWAYNKTTPVESEKFEDYAWSQIGGDKGEPGVPGKDGTPRYTWTRWADTPTNGMSASNVGKKYIGWAFNKPSATPSSNFEDYTWSLMPQNITVGGRNLVRGSNFLVESSSYGMRDYVITDEKLLSSDDVVITLKGILGVDRTHFRAYNSGGNSPSITLTDIGNGLYQYIGKWVTPSGVNLNSFLRIFQFTSAGTSSSTIEWVKFERGDTPTDWSPAPEDIENELDDNKNKIEAVEKTTKENTANIALNAQGIQMEATERKLLGERLESEMKAALLLTSDSLSLVISKIANDQALTESELQEFKTYFRWDANGSIIGKDGHPITLHQTNTGIEIRENGTVIAFWEQGTMSVDNLIAKMSIVIGTHLAEKYDSPTVGLTTIWRMI